MLLSLSLLPSRALSRDCGLIIARLDVELALQTGLPTLFPSDTVLPANGVSGDCCILKDQLPSTASRLASIMLSVASFATDLNNRESEGRLKLDPLTYMEILVSLLYRLIDFAPLGQPLPMSGGLYDDMIHLAMLAFMTTLLPEYGGDCSSPLLSDRLESAMLNVTSADTLDSEPSLLLWALFIGGISVLKRQDHRCSILETCERLDLQDWSAVYRQLCKFPWIHTLHDVPGRCLWKDAQRRDPEMPQSSLRPAE